MPSRVTFITRAVMFGREADKTQLATLYGCHLRDQDRAVFFFAQKYFSLMINILAWITRT